MTTSGRALRLAPLLLLLAVLVPPLAADWLVTHEGEIIPTAGAYEIRGTTVHFTEPGGVTSTLEAEAIDFEATERHTELAQPQVVLYMTTWCGYCRKTRALLTDLGVPFREKDIERDSVGRQEFEEKGRGYGGIPLLDVGGTVVRGYKPELITELVGDLGAGEGDAIAPDAAVTEAAEPTRTESR